MTNQSNIRVDIISDVVCPWCVIGYSQLAKAARETGIAIDVHWHPFELNAHMVEAGENLREHMAAKYGTTPEGSRQARARLTETAAALGFTFEYADDSRIWNTFQAHQLIDWAEDQGKAHELKLALFAAYFTRGENVSDPEVLAQAAAQIGLDDKAARRILESGERAENVRRKQEYWTSRGVQGVPAMIFERKHAVVGARGEDGYAAVLTQLAAAKVE